MMLSEVETDEDKKEPLKVKSIFCYTIAPNMRRQGIATKLLEYVCKDAADNGFDCVEAYPYSKFTDEYYDHMGPIDLYKKQNFEPYQITVDRTVMRKYLVK